jgi:hypothetical protein
VPDAVRALGPSVQAIAVDDYGPGHDLLFALTDTPELAAKIVATKSADFSAACYALEARIRERRARFRQSDYYAVMASAVAAAERTTGKSWQWERRVSVSQTPVVSATLATWALARVPDSGSFFVY